MYFHARSLAARTGRFGQADPVFAGLFEPQRWNRYSYALNAPVSEIDPDGELTISSSVNGCTQWPFWSSEYVMAGCAGGFPGLGLDTSQTPPTFYPGHGGGETSGQPGRTTADDRTGDASE
jgi:hypothetical protein